MLREEMHLNLPNISKNRFYSILNKLVNLSQHFTLNSRQLEPEMFRLNIE
jgi:hypothetical protein